LAQLIDQALQGSGVRDKESIKRGLLQVLFPRIGNTGYGPDFNAQWAREQRICSDEYFHRYFTYSVPPGDIADLEVVHLVQGLGTGTINEANADTLLRTFADRRAIPNLVGKLRSQEETIEPAFVRPSMLAIARNGAVVPRERSMMLSDWTFMQAAILVAHLLKRLPMGRDRDAFAAAMLAAAEPLPFACECFRWIRKSDDVGEDKRIVPTETEQHLGTALADRIRVAAAETPLYKSFGADAPRLYWLWSKYRGYAEVRGHLKARFDSNEEEVDEFLGTYVGWAWGMETGLAHRSDFSRDRYNAVAELIEADLVVAKLKNRYDAELDTPDYHQSQEVPIARRIAHQFAFLHEKAKAESQQQPGTVGSTEA
jgi:hypothetical protein